MRAQMFNYITGYVEPAAMSRVSLSPRDLRRNLMALIDAKIAHARAGQKR